MLKTEEFVLGDLKIVSKETLPCPFCKREVFIAEIAVIHSMPMCRYFLNMETDDFLKEVKKRVN